MTTEQRSPINTVSVAGDLDPDSPFTELHFADGRILRLATALLQQAMQPERLQATTLPSAGGVLVPLVEEQLQVHKRVVETGKMRLHKTAEEYDVTIDEPLAATTWQVERVAKHEVVERAPLTRQEGETTVYPIVEERLVLTKELVLIEEVHVTPIVSERRDTRTITLRRENLSIEHKTADQL